MDIERKQFRGEIKQTDDEGSFEAVIATLDVVDADGDIILPGAFQNATVSVLPAHNSRSVPLGKAKMEDRGNKAVAVGQFNLDVAAAKDWHSALKFDLKNGPSIQEWSFAFRIIESSMETRDGEDIRILEKLDVMEVSPVLRGSGVDTGTLIAKTRFADQLDSTLQVVENTLERAKAIAKLRASNDKPKTLSDDHKAKFKTLRKKFTEIENTFWDNNMAKQTTIDGQKFCLVDNINIKGDALSSFLNGRIDSMVNDSRSRSDIVQQVATRAGLTPSTINQILNGSINCPTSRPVAAFAAILSVGRNTIIERMRRDGCEGDVQDTRSLEIDTLTEILAGQSQRLGVDL